MPFQDTLHTNMLQISKCNFLVKPVPLQIRNHKNIEKTQILQRILIPILPYDTHWGIQRGLKLTCLWLDPPGTPFKKILI